MIRTWSKFNYGLNITVNNRYLNFGEGGPELTAILETGDYSLAEFPDALASAMSDVGSQAYSASIARSNNNLLTISAPGPFELFVNTGSNAGSDPFELIGFEYPSDLTGTNTYTGNTDCGSQYFPQFLLQSFVNYLNSQRSYDPTTNKTPAGRVEVVSFGIDQFFEMDIKFITDLPMDGKLIRTNSTGLADAIDFMLYATQKNKFEFVPDIDDPGTFYKVILESSPGFSDGTGFKLKELFGQNLPDIYETGVITLRIVP
jgi:hypothetical protein